MFPIEPGVRQMKDPEAQLEQSLIEEFLRGHGHDLQSVRALPEHEATRLWHQAAAYAGAKLAEVEARAHFLHELHGQT